MKNYVQRFRMRRAAKTLEVGMVSNFLDAHSRIYSEASELTGRLRQMQQQFLFRETYAFLSNEYKVDRLYNRVKYFNKRLISICHKLADPDVLQHCLQRREEEDMEVAYPENIQRGTSAHAKTEALEGGNAAITRFGNRRTTSANNAHEIRDINEVPASLADGAKAIRRRFFRGKDADAGQSKVKDSSSKAGTVESKLTGNTASQDAWKGSSEAGTGQQTFNPQAGKSRKGFGTGFSFSLHKIANDDAADGPPESIKSFVQAASKARWHMDKSQMLAMWEAVRLYAAGLAVVGSLSAMWQNEMLISGDGSKLKMDLLKAINSICSLLCALCIMRIYYLRFMIDRLYEHVHKLMDYDNSGVFWVFISRKAFWLEFVIAIVHCPPRLEHGFGFTFMKNYVAYRIETVLCCFNMLRFYLVWRAVVSAMLSDLPKQRATLAGLSNVNLGSTFVIKRMLNSYLGFMYLCTLWALSMVWFGYWYRAAESSACQFPNIGLKPM